MNKSLINKSNGSNVRIASEYWDDILRICEDVEHLIDKKQSNDSEDSQQVKEKKQLFQVKQNSSISPENDQTASLGPGLNEELQNLRNTVVELRKLCCCILGQLQNTHHNMAQLRNNLTQKELLSVTLSKQLVELKASYCLDRLKTFVTPIRQHTATACQTNAQDSTDASVEHKENQKNCFNCEKNRCLVPSLLSENERLERRLCILLKSLQQLSSELRESHANFDSLEIAFNWMRNEMKSLLKMRSDECELMRERVNYLTSKLLTVDRAYRASARKFGQAESIPK